MTRFPSSLNTLLFDWDGTISDTSVAGLEAFEKTFAELGYAITRSTYNQIYSPNWYSMYEAIALPRELWPKADDLWLYHYGQRQPHFVDGAGEVIAKLRHRGYRMGIVSSGTCSRVAREIEQLGLKELFEAIVCNEALVHKKPHPEGLEKGMAQMNCLPDSCCYIGDSPEDIQMGKNAGISTVGILSGYPTSRNLEAENPDLCLNSIRQMLQYFKGSESPGSKLSV